jgi:hypothetical protein
MRERLRLADLLPAGILNTVTDEQRPRLQVQQSPGHPHGANCEGQADC